MKNDETWYYEYRLTVVDELSDESETLDVKGLICVDDGTFLTAMSMLIDYYDEKNIVCVNYLAPVLTGPVVEYSPKLNCLVEFANSNHNKNEFKYLFKGENVCE